MTIPVGIDLGTTFSSLAILNSYGKAEIIPNSEGERITPSAIMFTPEGSIVVGTIAKNSAIAEPERVVEFIKRQMGSATYFFPHQNKDFSPVELAAMILKKLKQDAQIQLGDKLTDAVITVPAYFNDAQRQATLDAGKIAGFNVLKIINEPTAAALAYGCFEDRAKRVLVYDLGGGTFDVTLLDIKKGGIDVIATDGDHMLGGKDFDDRLMLHINSQFQRQYGKNLLEDLAVEQDLRQRAEAAKKALSQRSSTRVSINAYGHSFTAEISREIFEELTADLLARTEMLIESVFAAAKTNFNSLDEILLVGGSTRMPCVSNLIERISGKKPVQKINPDEAVSLGAALQCGILLAQKGEGYLLNTASGRALAATSISDVTSHSFGVMTYNTYKQKHENTIMIPKNTKIPAEKRERFYTVERGDSVSLVVLQGEDLEVENCLTIGETELDFGVIRPQGYPVNISYRYDENMMIHATITDPATNRRAEIHIVQEGRLTDAQVSLKKLEMTEIIVE